MCGETRESTLTYTLTIYGYVMRLPAHELFQFLSMHQTLAHLQITWPPYFGQHRMVSKAFFTKSYNGYLNDCLCFCYVLHLCLVPLCFSSKPKVPFSLRITVISDINGGPF